MPRRTRMVELAEVRDQKEASKKIDPGSDVCCHIGERFVHFGDRVYAFRLWSHEIDSPTVFSECCFGVMVLSGFRPTVSNLDGECL